MQWIIIRIQKPFHIDEKAASESIFGGLVASSLRTLSACTRVVVEAQGNVAILSGVGTHEAKMFNPVRPGDTLSVGCKQLLDHAAFKGLNEIIGT